MKFIKKHINAIVGLGVILLVIIGLLILKDIFYPTENKAIYGTRTEGVKKNPIKDEQKNAIIAAFNEKANSTTIRIAGRIIYIDIEAESGLTPVVAKELGNKVLEVFSDSEKAYYDIQVI